MRNENQKPEARNQKPEDEIQGSSAFWPLISGFWFLASGFSSALARILIAAVLFCSISVARAASSPFDSVHVYLITVGPGAEVYEKFGHNMIRFVGPAAALGQTEDIDVAFNWGVFSFDQPHFLRRFIQGRMLYSTAAEDYPDQLAEYRQNDRSVWQQELNLSPEQKERLWARLLDDIQPEHRDYRYDYYRDNCSTRSRDALDSVLNGQLREQLENTPTGTTYRWHTRRLMQGNFWLYTGLQYVLGHPVDEKINAWQQCFLPVCMMRSLAHVSVIDAAGKSAPLVLNQRQIFQSRQYLDPDSPPHWIWLYTCIGIALAILLMLPVFTAMRWRQKIIWGVIAFAWCALGAAAAGILIFGQYFTDHVVTTRNENIFQLSPIMWGILVLIPVAAWGKRWAVRVALVLACIQAAGNLLGLLQKHFPIFYQPNYEIIALTLPANIGLAIGLAAIYRRIQSSRHAQ